MPRSALYLLVAQGCLGAFDTLYYHEWRYRLAGSPVTAGRELRLHAARDFIYAVLLATAPFVAWGGPLAWALVALLASEVAITLADFVVEDRVRAPWGGVAPGERAMHAVMAIVYGAVLAELAPAVLAWSRLPLGFARHARAPGAAEYVCAALAAGVFASGARDLGASCGVAACGWPWARPAGATRGSAGALPPP
ncbi:MAG TPA: hypothetical protein VFS00_29555 [Polyangiaceae bacterium]|nr:hypothetical protein [Polyangiaceae bacterium]